MNKLNIINIYELKVIIRYQVKKIKNKKNETKQKEYKVNRILELDLKNRRAIITKKEQERERETEGSESRQN